MYVTQQDFHQKHKRYQKWITRPGLRAFFEKKVTVIFVSYYSLGCVLFSFDPLVIVFWVLGSSVLKDCYDKNVFIEKNDTILKFVFLYHISR